MDFLLQCNGLTSIQASTKIDTSEKTLTKVVRQNHNMNVKKALILELVEIPPPPATLFKSQ